MYFGYKILQFNLYWKIESKKKKNFFLFQIYFFIQLYSILEYTINYVKINNLTNRNSLSI